MHRAASAPPPRHPHVGLGSGWCLRILQNSNMANAGIGGEGHRRAHLYRHGTGRRRTRACGTATGASLRVLIAASTTREAVPHRTRLNVNTTAARSQ
jgi:hypothetical protein